MHAGRLAFSYRGEVSKSGRFINHKFSLVPDVKSYIKMAKSLTLGEGRPRMTTITHVATS
jgi:hypothetical protein